MNANAICLYILFCRIVANLAAELGIFDEPDNLLRLE